MIVSHQDRIVLGAVVTHDDPATGKHLLPTEFRTNLHTLDAALGRECAVAGVYADHGVNMGLDLDLCSEAERLGKHVCHWLWPDEVEDAAGVWSGVPIAAHSLDDIVAGRSDDIFREHARQAVELNRPLFYGVDEPNNFGWAHPSQGGDGNDTLDGMPWPRGPAQFIRAWRRIAGIMRTEAPKVTLMVKYVGGWGGPDQTNNPANWWKHPKWWWVGESYVDWVGGNALNWAKLKDGTPLWRTWDRAEDSIQEVTDFLALMPGSQYKPLYLEFNAGEDPTNTAAKRLLISRFLTLCETSPAHLTAYPFLERLNRNGMIVGLWSDGTYVEGGDIAENKPTAYAARQKVLRPVWSSQLGSE